MAKRLIRIYQSRSEYPSLHVMITDNPRYLKEGVTVQDAEEAIKRIREWLKEHIIDQSKSSY